MIEKTGNDLVVIASNPQELVESQQATIGKVAEKIRDADIEVRQARVTIDAGQRAGINVGPAKKILAKCVARAMFLGKVHDALEAGYVIVPNFPGETIAIRVKRNARSDGDRPNFRQSQ